MKTIFYAKSEEQDDEDFSWHSTSEGDKLGYFESEQSIKDAIAKATGRPIHDRVTIVEKGDTVRWKICELATLNPSKYLKKAPVFVG